MNDFFNFAVILTAVDHFSGPMKNVARSMSNFDQMVERGQNWQMIGQRITASGALTQHAAGVMARGLNSILQPARDVEDALAMVGTVIQPMSGTVEDALGRVRHEALAWSKAHQDSAEDFIRTTYMMISAGLDETAAVEATRTAMGVATATMGDSTEAANLMAVVYNNMADKTKDARSEFDRIGDTLTKTQQTFQFANLNQLTEGMKYAIPVALQYGSGLSEISVVMGALNNAGLQGSMAGTAWAATMRNLGKASRELGFEVGRTADGGVDFIATLANIEAKYGSIADLSPQVQEKFQSAFGDEGLRAMSLLVGQSQELSETMLDVAGATGTVEAAQKRMEESGSGGFKRLHNNVQALYTTLGTALMPTLNNLLPKVIAIVDAVGKFADANPGLVETGLIIAGIATAVLAVVAPIITVVGSIITVTGAAMSTFGAIGAGAVWLLPKVAAASMAIAQFGATILFTAGTAARAMIASLARMGLMLGGALLTGIRAAIAGFRMLSIAMLGNPVGLIVTGIALAAGLILYYWQPITGFFSRLWDGVTATFTGFTTWLTGWWGRLGTDTLGAIGELLAVFWRFSPAGILQQGLSAAVDLLAATEWGSLGIAIVEGLADGFKGAMGKLMAPVEEMASGIKTKFKSLLGIQSPSKVFAGFGGDLVAGLSQGISGNQKGAFARAAALAAGVAASAAMPPPDASAAVAIPAIARSPSTATAPGYAAAPVTAPTVAAPATARGPQVVDLPATSSGMGGDARRPSAASGVSVTVNFNPTVTITGGGATSAEDIRQALRDLGPDLARVVEDAVDRAGRTRY